MATRTLPSERDRKMTIMLTPFMSCSAKLPIYGFFIATFFPGKGGLVMVSLYFLGILVGLLAALISKSFFKGEPVPFVMELPNYRMPALRNVLRLMWDKAKDFLQRAFTVIFIGTIVIWFLRTFDFGLNMVGDPEESMLAALAGMIAPILKPLGMGDWRISTALISGFLAKESVVSTLTVLYGDPAGLAAAMSMSTAVVLLVFCLLYTPCVAAIAAVRRESGSAWAAGMVVLQCAVAWLCAFCVRLLVLMFGY
jgi:ferrous iron transport protein B